MHGFNIDLQTQIDLLEKIIMSSEILSVVLKKTSNIKLPNYYIGAGCIAQTIWNYQMDFVSANGISDIDFVYYNDSDLSFEAEDSIIKQIVNEINPCPIKLDIKNQARVHI